MKKIFILLLLSVSLTSYAQRQLTNYVVGKGIITQVAATINTLDIKINFLDESSFYNGNDIDSTCVLVIFNRNDSRGYELPISKVISANYTNPILRVNIGSYSYLNGAINGVGVVYKKNSPLSFAPFVSGITPSFQQVIQEDVLRNIENVISGSSTISVIKYSGNGVPSNSLSSSYKLAQGDASPYPFYVFNGVSWVLVGSGSSSTIDTNALHYVKLANKINTSDSLSFETKSHNLSLLNYYLKKIDTIGNYVKYHDIFDTTLVESKSHSLAALNYYFKLADTSSYAASILNRVPQSTVGGSLTTQNINVTGIFSITKAICKVYGSGSVTITKNNSATLTINVPSGTTLLNCNLMIPTNENPGANIQININTNGINNGNLSNMDIPSSVVAMNIDALPSSIYNAAFSPNTTQIKWQVLNAVNGVLSLEIDNPSSLQSGSLQYKIQF